MPSWPSRLLHGPPPTSNHLTPPIFSNRERSFHNDSQRDVQRQINPNPDGSVSVSVSPSPGSNPVRHGRSISTPSLSGLAINGERDGTGEEIIRRADASLPGSLSPALQSDVQTTSAYKAPTPHRDTDLVAGKCATCDSLVRWPRHLNVFRCSVCLMVNDLKPNTVESSKDNGRRAQSPVKREGAATFKSKPVPRISLSKTKSIIDECICLYLETRLGSPKGGTKARVRWHPADNSVDPMASLESEKHESPKLSIPVAWMDNPARSQSNMFVEPTENRISGSTTSTLQSLATGSRKLNPRSHQLPSSLYPQPSPSRPPPPPPITTWAMIPEHPQEFMESTENVTLDPLKSIFEPLENYIAACFSECDCLNASFLVPRAPLMRAASEGTGISKCLTSNLDVWADNGNPLSELDAKTLLLGDFAENGMWWTGRWQAEPEVAPKVAKKGRERDSGDRVSMKTPRIHWGELNEWYHAVLSAGHSWKAILHEIQLINSLDGFDNQYKIPAEDQQKIEGDLSDARNHVQRTLLKSCESLLRRPGIQVRCPEDCRFLLILLTNPILNLSESSSGAAYAVRKKTQRPMSQAQRSPSMKEASAIGQNSISAGNLPDTGYGGASKHSSILKRIFGIMSNLPDDCHHHLITWFSRYSESHFRRTVELVGSFVTYRLTRQHGRKRSNSHETVDELIPKISRSGVGSSAQLHAALGITGTSKFPDNRGGAIAYSEDWQIKAAARMMSLLFSANFNGHRRQDVVQMTSSEIKVEPPLSAAYQRVQRHGQILPTSAFYNTLLDYSDLIAEFETWEIRKGKFSFCQYPMFLSMWAKIYIMGYDARRQMEIKAREAFFNSIMRRKAVNQYLVLKVRRDCLVEDSLRGVSEVVGTGQEEIKKGLRIEFCDEEGVDAGGLRKEWFLLLVREVFDPEHGLFVYDEDSHYCYFNPNTFETSDQFFLVGVVFGLAIYNSTILDVALPPFTFRKLLPSPINYSGSTGSSVRLGVGYTLEDLAEFRPALAKGLGQLLDFDGDVEKTFCRDFVAEVDRYGQVSIVPLCSNGENRPVTNKNRREFVDLYVHYLLDTAVARQFEPFKRGFFSVCGGNALSLFQPEEIELLVRGSDEPLDVATLRSVAIYDGWSTGQLALVDPVIEWFWATFASADVKDQRKLLSFITSSDRIPAMGAASLVIKITCLGDDCNRYPIARTCFNTLGIYRYRSRKRLEMRLWRAVFESEGFGLK